MRSGNAYATLTIPAGPRLRPGTYELAFKVETERLDGGCANATEHWVEAGRKSGTFSRDDLADRRWFTRAVVDDFGASCGRFASFSSGSPRRRPRTA